MDRRLLAEARTARTAFYLTIGLSVAIGLLVIGQAFILSRVINRVFMQQATLSDVSSLLVILAGVVLLRAALNWGSTYAAAAIAIRVKADLRRRLMQHLLALGPTYMKGERSGELTTTATEGIEALDAYFRDYLPGLFTALLIPLSILFVVLPIDLLTFIVLFITAPLIPLFMALIGMAAGVLAKSQYKSMGRMSAHFLDVLQGLTTLKLFNRSKSQIEIIGKITDQFRATTMDVLRIAFLSAFTLELLSTISIALVAVEIGLRLLAGNIAFEPALFLLVIAPEFYLPLRTLGAKFHAGTEGTAAAGRIFEVLQTPIPDATDTQITAIPEQKHLIVKNVTLAYEEGARPALNGVSFEIQPGECVALVGPSGSGKTTIANLLLRFAQPDTGDITVGGVDLGTLQAEDWRREVAWVPQAPYLFNISVVDNIRLGMADAPLEAVIEAAKAAEAHDFITALPEGYDTIAGERGSRLSGGQAQRIALARAFLKDAPILILDEATANLDLENEALIDESLSRLMQGRTVLVIAHRLNTVFRADRILVLDQGEIVERGKHEALMAQNGTYSKLVSAYGEVAYDV